MISHDNDFISSKQYFILTESYVDRTKHIDCDFEVIETTDSITSLLNNIGDINPIPSQNCKDYDKTIDLLTDKLKSVEVFIIIYRKNNFQNYGIIMLIMKVKPHF